jgi:hypothetical protein
MLTYLTSPWRRMNGAFGYISMNSFGRGYEKSVYVQQANMHLNGTYSVGTGISRCGQNHRKVKDLSNCSMRHDVVLVQTGVPVPCDMVEADLDVEDEKNLMMYVSSDTAMLEMSNTYRVVLINTLPWNSFKMLIVIEE